MTNPLIAEELARQHRQDLLANAARARLVRHAGGGWPWWTWPWWTLSWRARAGRSLIRAGVWLGGRGADRPARRSQGLATAWRDAAS